MAMPATEQQKIAASAEASRYPAIALAAIRSRQTFEQFRANVAALEGREVSALPQAHAIYAARKQATSGKSPRAAKPSSPAAAAAVTPQIDAAAIYAKRNKAGKRV